MKFLLVAAFVAVVAATDLKSPCPEFLEYGDQTAEGKYEVTLNLKNEHTLHGVWVRIFFDGPVTKLSVVNDAAEVIGSPDTQKEFLIKNRDTLLKKNEPIDIKLLVEYEGPVPPALTSYRLNARTVCPADQE